VKSKKGRLQPSLASFVFKNYIAGPSPTDDFRQVHAVFGDILLVLHRLDIHRLMSTEQVRFAKPICKKSKFALFYGKTNLFCPFQIHWLAIARVPGTIQKRCLLNV